MAFQLSRKLPWAGRTLFKEVMKLPDFLINCDLWIMGFLSTVECWWGSSGRSWICRHFVNRRVNGWLVPLWFLGDIPGLPQDGPSHPKFLVLPWLAAFTCLFLMMRLNQSRETLTEKAIKGHAWHDDDGVCVGVCYINLIDKEWLRWVLWGFCLNFWKSSLFLFLCFFLLWAPKPLDFPYHSLSWACIQRF